MEPKVEQAVINVLNGVMGDYDKLKVETPNYIVQGYRMNDAAGTVRLDVRPVKKELPPPAEEPAPVPVVEEAPAPVVDEVEKTEKAKETESDPANSTEGKVPPAAPVKKVSAKVKDK